MAHKILEEDWSDYDKRKLTFQDRLFFSCDERWEVEYLIKKIKNHTTKTEAQIRLAIGSCCVIVPGNKPRDKFVECVMARL